MNANLTRISIGILVATLVCGTSASAFSFPDIFVDPLSSVPAVVEKGVILPGDKAPIASSVVKDFSHPLTLGDAVDLALCNNPQIKYAWADIKIKASAVGAARAAYLPTVTGSINRANDHVTYPDDDFPSSTTNRTTWQGGLYWRIFDFGDRAANSKNAKNLLTAALATHNAIVQRALSDVIQAYFDAMTAKATLNASIKGEEIARVMLNSAEARKEKGAISQADTLRAKTALAKAVLENNRAHGDNQKALAVLGHILGLPSNQGISLPEEINANISQINKDLNMWLQESQKNHPAIIAAKAQVEAAQKRVKVARAAGLPVLNFAANYYENTTPGQTVTANETRETILTAGVTIPLFDGFSTTYKIRGAQAEVQQKEAELADTEYRIAFEVIKAYADATSALQNLDASANLLQAAQEALSVSQRRYDKGAADITELLSTQSTLSDAQRERIRCLAEWHSARLRLLASAGQMGRTAVASQAESTPSMGRKVQ